MKSWLIVTTVAMWCCLPWPRLYICKQSYNINYRTTEFLNKGILIKSLGVLHFHSKILQHWTRPQVKSEPPKSPVRCAIWPPHSSLPECCHYPLAGISICCFQMLVYVTKYYRKGSEILLVSYWADWSQIIQFFCMWHQVTHTTHSN
jgi:hypothetical protein